MCPRMLLLRFIVVFFFFKQKTAYEMRISDWSSDVCSSDLVEHIGINSQQSGTLGILAQVRAGNLTLRQVVERLATPRGAFVGSPETVADRLQQWFEAGAADGLMLFEPLPGDRKSTRLNSRHSCASRMPASA